MNEADAAAAARWRRYGDRLIVLVVILAVWQGASAVVGAYWLSSPWATLARA